MQKRLIALAIAAAATAPAFAQSSVTIYGVADGTIENVKASGATGGSVGERPSMGRVVSNSSLIGFKGVEDLGGGLKAVFQLEQGFDLQSGAAGQGLATRDTYVGLAGNWGTAVIGLLTDPYRLFGAKVDMNPGATTIGFTGSIYGEVTGLGLASNKTTLDDRKSNAVAYTTPTVAGFHAVAAYVAGENKANSTQVAPGGVNSRAWDLAAVYEWQKLFLGYAHVDARDALGVANQRVKADRAIATYAFATGTSVSALWDQFKLNLPAADAKRKAWGVAVKQNFGANNVWAQYTKGNDVTGSLGGGDTGAKQVTLGYSYDLSKRTMIHAYWSKITNESAANYDFYVNAVGRSGGSIGAGADPQGYGIGLRHMF